MYLKLLFRATVLTSSLFFFGCASVEKHNEKRSRNIPVAQLQKDIDYVECKLHKLHPSLDLYLTKEQLSYKFDSIRAVVNKPMTSKEFYFVISPVIASVHQGHMSMFPMSKRYSNKELKRAKKAGEGPLSQFKYDWEDNKLYIIKNNSKEKDIQIGTEIVSIKGVKPQQIYQQYKQSITSDGYNTTFKRKYFLRRFTIYLTEEIDLNDSLTFELKFKDSLYTKVIARKKTEKKVNALLSKQSPKLVASKSKSKTERKNKKVFGYDAKTKEYSKSLRFIGKDTTVAYLKINNFTEGIFRKAYKSIFDSIKKVESKTLIIDLRDNPGGRMSDIHNLYSYLTNEKYAMIQPAIVTSKTSLWRAGLFANVPKLMYPVAGVSYPFFMSYTFFKTKKADDGTFYCNSYASKVKEPNPNNFKGKIYVLINGGSFSASCLLSSALKANKDVTFVGEETGGDFNGTVAGFMPQLTLPNSRIKWRLGLLDIRPVNQTKVIGHGIYPDKEIIQTVEDKINGKDPELEWILKEIGK
jgi:hypothetical protein